MNKFTVGLGFLGLASSQKIIFTQMPDSIPGNFTTYQYDLDTDELKAVATGLEESYTAWDFVSGAAVCGNTYYASIDDSIIDWGFAAINLDSSDVQIWNSKEMPTTNLLHNIWCDPSDDNSLYSVQSTTNGNAVFGVYHLTVAGNKVSQNLIAEFPKTSNDMFLGYDTEFQATPDRSQIWGNFGTATLNSGHLHVMDVKTGQLTSYDYPMNGYPYTSVPLDNGESPFLTVSNGYSWVKGQGSFDGSDIKVSQKVESPESFTGSQPWTVDASNNKIYVIANVNNAQQALEVLNAKTGDIELSKNFNEIVKRGGHVGGLALL